MLPSCWLRVSLINSFLFKVNIFLFYGMKLRAIKSENAWTENFSLMHLIQKYLSMTLCY